MPTFEKGALVRLKSGGPVMTVDRVPGEESGHHKMTWGGLREIRWYSYRCVWFDENELKSDVFEEYLLVAVDTQSVKS
jgi:uncharacterized protein YodC (DUF2158 family)